MEALNNIPDIITGISSSDTVGLVLKIVLAVLMFGGLIWFGIWSKKAKDDKANAETSTTQQQDHSNLPVENQTIEGNGQAAQTEIENIFNKK